MSPARRPQSPRRRVLILSIGLLVGCDRSPSETLPPATTVLIGAGDIANCAFPGAALTASMLDTIQGTVFTTGDNAYPEGKAADFEGCYKPTWGRHVARTRPSPGNHDYYTPNAAAYFDYFGMNAGPGRTGYYSYAVTGWHVIALNSNVAMTAGSAQYEWLRADLAAHGGACTIAYWHHPLFSSGRLYATPAVRPLWEALYAAGVELVLNGHHHSYERFAPMTPAGEIDPVRGIREIVVGTGGAGLYSFDAPAPNSEVRFVSDYGLLKLTLAEGSYSWEFVTVTGARIDSGSASCH
jgi:acid phosphatase type 7